MDALPLFVALFYLVGGPVMLTALLAGRRKANIVGGVMLFLFTATAIFGPQEPHPYIPAMAMFSIMGLLVGWALAYVITLLKKA